MSFATSGRVGCSCPSNWGWGRLPFHLEPPGSGGGGGAWPAPFPFWGLDFIFLRHPRPQLLVRLCILVLRAPPEARSRDHISVAPPALYLGTASSPLHWPLSALAPLPGALCSPRLNKADCNCPPPIHALFPPTPDRSIGPSGRLPLPDIPSLSAPRPPPGGVSE